MMGRRARYGILAGLISLAVPVSAHPGAQGRHTAPLSIHDVQSFNYFIAPGVAGAPGGGRQFRAAAAEAYDMFIADYYSGHDIVDAAAVQEFQDSSPRGRLAIAYLDADEFMRCCSNIDRAAQDGWFDAAGGLTPSAPGWLGPRNPKFRNLWSVREWDPHWQAYILNEIDTIIAAGFDGVFLDMLYSDDTWGPRGFAAGRAGTVDYRSSQLKLAAAIWDHVRNELKNSRFIIIANYSGVAQDNIPALTVGLSYADAFMKESEYFARDDRPAPWTGGKSIGEYFAARSAGFFARMTAQNKVVMLQHYDLSFEHEALVLEECASYGYLASHTHFPQNLIHIDGLPVCTATACSADTAAGRHVSFDRSARVPSPK